jgi:hypothetical protein
MSGAIYLSPEEMRQLAARQHYGPILHHHRLLLGWSAERVGLLYAEALGKEASAHTCSWIYEMEKRNRVPQDEVRRRILAGLLDIPLVLLGLQELDPTSPVARELLKPVKVALLSFTEIDQEEYRATLERYNAGWHDRSVFEQARDLGRRILLLREALPPARGRDRTVLAELLCGYSCLALNVLHDQRQYGAAMKLADYVIALARHEGLYDYLLTGLRLRGNAPRQWGDIKLVQEGPQAAQSYYKQALRYFNEGRQVENHAQPLHRARFSSSIGIALAAVARDRRELNEALKMLEREEQLATGLPLLGGAGLPILGTSDKRGWLLDRTAGLLAYSYRHGDQQAARLALADQEAAKKAVSMSGLRMPLIYQATLEARALALAGQHEMAAAQAHAALEQVEPSRMNLERLKLVHRILRASPYGTSSDVALLGVALLGVKLGVKPARQQEGQAAAAPQNA